MDETLHDNPQGVPPQSEVTLHSAQGGAKEISKRARAEKELEGTLPETSKGANKEAEQAKQGKAAMPTSKGSAETEGPKKLSSGRAKEEVGSPLRGIRMPPEARPHRLREDVLKA